MRAPGCGAEGSAPHNPASLGQNFVYLQETGGTKKTAGVVNSTLRAQPTPHSSHPHTRGSSWLAEVPYSPGECRASPGEPWLCSVTRAQKPGVQPPAPAPCSLQHEQYNSSMTRKQLSRRALGRTSFRLSLGALRSDTVASTLGLTSTSWKEGGPQDQGYHRPNPREDARPHPRRILETALLRAAPALEEGD